MKKKIETKQSMTPAFGNGQQLTAVEIASDTGDNVLVADAVSNGDELEEAHYQAWRVSVSGFTSFGDLQVAEQIEDRALEIRRLTIQFNAMIENIMFSDSQNKRGDVARLTSEFLDLVSDETDNMESEEEEVEALESVKFDEAGFGYAVELVENATENAPLVIDVVIIQPGWGNKRDNNFYPREMLEQCAGVFGGAKMYTTDHRDEERSVRTEVSQIMECPVAFTESGAPIARVGVFDEVFAGQIRNRAKLGVLTDLHCSIMAGGTVEPGFEMGERTGSRVKSINEVLAVDWVTRAGAGGHALNIIESEDITMKDHSKKGDKEEEVQEGDEIETILTESENDDGSDDGDGEKVTQSEGGENVTENEKPEITLLSQAKIVTTLGEFSLPDVTVNRLRGRSYLSEDDLRKAVADEIAYIKEFTDSGKPPGTIGSGSNDQSGLISETDVQAKKDKINAKYLRIGGKAR